MNNLKEANALLLKKREAYDKRGTKINEQIRALKQQIEDLEAREKRMRWPYLQDVFKPFIDKISRKLKAKSYEFLGPFGLNSEMCVHFQDGSNKKGADDVFASLNFVSRGDGYHLRNYKKKVNHYPEGCIAEMNGDNFEVLEPTRKMNITWLAKFAKDKEAKK